MEISNDIRPIRGSTDAGLQREIQQGTIQYADAAASLLTLIQQAILFGG